MIALVPGKEKRFLRKDSNEEKEAKNKTEIVNIIVHYHYPK